ncbi:MAG: hypothetical protein ABI083_15775, partial [Lapillicoccus sp.]
MTVTVPRPHTAPAAPPAPSPRSPVRRSVKERLFAPGWPLGWLFVGYPIWWILGVTEAATFVLSGVMAAALFRRKTTRTPPGFGLWLVFLGFSAAGILVLQVDAPGGVPGNSNGRYVIWALRMLWYFSAMIMMLYVGNFRREITLHRVSRILSWMFVVIVVGGVLGVLIPRVTFPSAIELVLPKSILNISQVQQMVHPSLAQFQQVLGYQEARPSAPFTYTNTWGLGLACFLPYFVIAWFGKDAGWRRIVGPFVLLAALAPVVQSLNRGLWGALVGVVVFVALRYAVMGRVRLLATILVSVTLATAVVFATPLANTIALRWAHQHSNQGRTDLGTATVTSVLDKSPVLGYGSTRQVQGSFNSIAGGSTAACPHCSPPSLGTQGQAWLLTFTTGLGGLLSWVAFFAFAFIRWLRLRSPYATVGLSVLLAHAITSIVYNVNGPGLLAILIAVAFLWRESGETDKPLSVGSQRRGALPQHSLGHYLTVGRRHLALFLLMAVVGAAGSAGYIVLRGVPSIATIGLTVDNQPTLTGDSPLTLDSEAQYVGSPQVVSAVQKATKMMKVTADDLAVTATPNSRVLHIGFEAPTATKAEAGVKAAAAAFLQVRTARLTAERQELVVLLESKVASANQIVTDSQARLAQAQLLPAAVNDKGSVRILNADIDRQVSELGRASARLERARNQSVQAGSIIETPLPKSDKDLVTIVAVSGGSIGVLLASMLAFASERLSLRTRWGRTIRRRTGLRVLATVPADGAQPIPGLRPLTQSLVSRGVRAALSGGTSRATLSTAYALDRSIAFEAERRPARHASDLPGVVLTADSRTRTGDL